MRRAEERPMDRLIDDLENKVSILSDSLEAILNTNSIVYAKEIAADALEVDVDEYLVMEYDPDDYDDEGNYTVEASPEW